MPIAIIIGILMAGGMWFVSRESGNKPIFDIDPDQEDDVLETGGYPDCSLAGQGGSYDTGYDDEMLNASHECDVPFALIKAHALAESNLKPNAIRNEPATSKRPPSASYGLMQILWWKGSNRFKIFGFPDDNLNAPSSLYDPILNCRIGAHFIQENLDRFGNLRDAINAYNTGVAESERKAPNGYVDKVLKFYSTLIKRNVL